MYDFTVGPARETVDRDEAEAQKASIVADDLRRRPLYFDGRFLAARDLTRDQQYFLARQSDLGRAGGFGVVEGLMVERDAASVFSLRIGAGHGVTPLGEQVILPADLAVNLADVPQIQRLDAAFGLAERPREAGANRTGLYVLGLRPVEYAANPIAAYPTQIGGQRTVELGDVVEATAVVLVPYPDEGAGATPEQRRARVAHELFVARGSRGEALPILPLAMVMLSAGQVRWLDPFLVRREVGADHGDVLGLGFSPRAVREAHLLQYDRHLADVIELRRQAGQGERFAASEYFQALPPAGRMPAAALNPADFTQHWFPPAVDVDLSIVPEDEVASLLEESLLLPPIDLTRGAEELDATSVMVLVPVPRARFRTLGASLGRVSRVLGSAAPWAVASRRPFEVLQGLRLSRGVLPALPSVSDQADAAWRTELPGAGMLWYVRRRSISHRGDVVGEAVPLPPSPPQLGEDSPLSVGTKPFPDTGDTTRIVEALRAGATTEPAAKERASNEPAPREPTASESSTTRSATTEPATTEPDTSKPAPAGTATTRPAATRPGTTKPAATGTATTRPTATRPATTKPPAKGTATTRPAASKPAPAGTATTRPAPTKPAATGTGTTAGTKAGATRTLTDRVIEAEKEVRASGGTTATGVATVKGDPQFGAGLERLAKASPELAENPKLATGLALSGEAARLDALAREVPDEELPKLTSDVLKTTDAVRDSTVARRLTTLMDTRLAGGEK